MLFHSLLIGLDTYIFDATLTSNGVNCQKVAPKNKKIVKKYENLACMQNVRVQVRLNFGKNEHVRAVCVWPKIECAGVRACDLKIRRNSHSVLF